MSLTSAGLKAAIEAKLSSKIEDVDFSKGNADDAIEALAEAIIEYITTNAIVSFVPGSITGLCPPGGGALSGGTGTGGTIS